MMHWGRCTGDDALRKMYWGPINGSDMPSALGLVQDVSGFIPEQTFIVEKEHIIDGLIKPCSAKGDQVFAPPQFWVLL